MKNKFLGVLIFLCVCFIGFSNVNAATLIASIPICANGTVGHDCGSASDKIWHTYGNGYTAQNTVFEMDGKIVYCVETGVDVTVEPNAYSPNNWSVTSLSNDQKIRIEAIGHFGYGYGNHTSYKWYLATQKLIWETVSPNLSVTLTKGENGPTYSVSNEEKEINSLVDQFLKKPSFAGKTIKGKTNDTIVLTDTNNVLQNWNLTSTGDYKASISGNKLTIVSDKAQNINLTFSRKEIGNTPTIVYTAGQYQMLAELKLSQPVTTSTSVKVVDVPYPEIDKEVDKDKVNIGEKFNYTFEYTIDKLESGVYYNSLLIEDQFEPCLKLTDLSQVKIYNEKDEEVTDLFNISIKDNKLEITVKDLQNADFYGHTYRVVVETEILENADLSDYNKDGVITVPNEVKLTVDDHISTDTVTITHTPIIVEVPKTAASVPLIILGVGLTLIVISSVTYLVITKKKKVK